MRLCVLHICVHICVYTDKTEREYKNGVDICVHRCVVQHLVWYTGVYSVNPKPSTDVYRDTCVPDKMLYTQRETLCIHITRYTDKTEREYKYDRCDIPTTASCLVHRCTHMMRYTSVYTSVYTVFIFSFCLVCVQRLHL